MTTQFSFKYYLVFVGFMLTFLYTFSAYGQDTGVTLSPAEGTGAVNVRSGPGTEYTIRFALNDGQTLVATGRTEASVCTGNAETDGWLRITVSENIEGWVSLCAVEVSGDVNNLPVAEPAFPQLIADTTPLQVLEGSTNFTNPDLVAQTNTAVVMRGEPWLGSEALGIVSAGTAIEMLQITEGAGWVEMQFGETTGWMPGFAINISEQQMQQLPRTDISVIVGSNQLVQTDCVNGASLVVSISDMIGGAFRGYVPLFPFYVFVCP